MREKRLQEKQKREVIQKNTLHITVPNAMKLMNEEWVNDEESCQITKNLLDAVLVFYANSGYFRYQKINEYDSNQHRKDIDLGKVERETKN